MRSMSAPMRAALLVCALVTMAAPLFAQCPAVSDAATPQTPSGTDFDPATTSITYRWAAPTNAPNVTGFAVFVSKVGSGSATAVCTGNATATSCNGNGLSNGTWEWLVNTKTSTCPAGVDSVKHVFTVGCALAAPVTQSPADQATEVSTTPTLKWSSVSGADSYDIFLGAAGQGCTANAPAGTVTSGTTFTPPQLQAGTAYEWRVLARRNGCATTATSSCVTFTTAASCAQPATFDLTAPANGATVTSAPTLTWAASAGAAGYRIHLAASAPPPTGTGVATTSGTSYTPQSLADGTYYWYVDAIPSCGLSGLRASTSIFRFTLQSGACPTAAPTNIAPATNATLTNGSPVAFSWNGVPNATSYEVIVGDGSGTNTHSLGTVSGGATSLNATLVDGTYYWLARANYANCPATVSAATRFTIATKSCFTSAPQLDRPLNNAANVSANVTFDWFRVSGATSYQLYAAIDGKSPAPLTVTADTEFTTTLAPSSIVEWYVIASADGCAAVESTHFKFTVAPSGCPASPQTPVPTSPADGAINLASPVAFSWTAAANATIYRVFGNIGSGELFLIGTSSTTSLTAPVPAGTLSWFVQAVFGDCPAATVSRRATATIATGTACQNSGPILVAPANAAANITSPVEFRWNSAGGATGYKLYVATNGGTADLIATTTETSATRIVAAGTSSWYVEAVFAGCSNVRSSTSTFSVAGAHDCGSGTITLLTPASGATVQSPVALSWSAVSGATSYRVYVSVDGSSPTLLARTGQTSATVSIPNGTAEWYVEAVFDNCNPVLSAKARFVVAKASNCDAHVAPTPIAPAANVTTKTPVQFSWTAAPGAVAYQVWKASNNQPFDDVGLTKETTLTKEMPVGNTSWFVVAFFDGCPALPSARTSFVVTSDTPRCSNEAPAIVTPNDGAQNVGSPVVLTWSGVAGAAEYRVYGALLGGSLVHIATTTETSIEKALPPGNYEWLVEAVFARCSSTKSARAHFTVLQRQNCTSEAPRLLAPADDAAGIADDVDFAWTPVSGANTYAVWVKPLHGAAAVIGTTQDTHLSRNLPDGEIEWWVVAFVAGCDSVSSVHFGFITDSPNACLHRKPVALTPADDAHDLVSPITFSWTAVAQAKSYKVWAAVGRNGASVVGSTTATTLTADVPAGELKWFIEALFDGCGSTRSAISSFTAVKTPPPCGTPEKPVTTVVGRTLGNVQFGVRWNSLATVKLYEVQEATAADFSNATTRTATGVVWPFTRTVSVPTQFYYRVRGISNCNDEKGPYSDVVSTIVTPPSGDPSVEVGTQSIVSRQVFIAGPSTPTPFTARGDKPWMTVTPSSGTIGPNGLTFTVTSDASSLPPGTNTGTILLTYGGSGKIGTNAGTTKFPISISLVTPVAPTPKNTPPPDSLIIPAVAHTAGANSAFFESDVRVTNTSAQTQKYQLNFTATATDATQSGQTTSIEVEPGTTMALDDILATFFGTSPTANAAGVLEIRPLSSSATASTFSQTTVTAVAPQTVASSRTFNTTPNGTFGQYVPAIPFASFIGQSPTAVKSILSLQQIAQSNAFRTNLGLVEGSGEAADVVLSVFDNANHKLAAIPLSLLPGEHRQLNSFLATNGISIADGRIEVEVVSSTGRVTAYASVVDNLTNDPLLVSPVLKGSTSSTRYVVPGVADLNNGFAVWRTDMRIFNDSAAPVTATVTYYPQSAPASSVATTITLLANEVRAIDNTLQSLLNTTNSGGSVTITTAAPANLIVTARTFDQTANGTFGQFIPAVTPADSVAAIDGRSLQLLQLESSNRFRTNIGIAETTGHAATAQVSVILADSKVIPTIEIPLQANEFRQFSLADFGLGDVYNARVTIRVTDGDGKVTAYGSVIDQITQDPTYVPAQ
jgi:hypothetical protein